MPIPAAVGAAAIAGGAQLAGTGISAFAQGKMNRKTRKWNEKMYGRQREDALADWHMMNAYNDPKEQMARLAAAGLNPNLVYGNGADATASAPPRSSDSGSWSPKAPEFDLGSAASAGLAAYYDVQVKDAQVQNLHAQNDVMQQDQFLKAAQVIATLEGAGKTRTDRYMTEFDLEMKERLANNSVEMAEASLEKLRADIKFTVNQDERAEALNASNIQEAVERILKMRMERALTNEQRALLKAQITNLGKDSELKQLDINLKKQGIQPGDEIYWRMIGQYLNKQGSTIMDDVKSIIPRSQNNYLNKKKGYRGAGGKW